MIPYNPSLFGSSGKIIDFCFRIRILYGWKYLHRFITFQVEKMNSTEHKNKKRLHTSYVGCQKWNFTIEITWNMKSI